jgi:hypothetical protein
MDIPKFGVSCFEGPFFVRVEVPESDVVDDDIFDEGIAW